ncbi:hypothetical protein [Streptomyces sp. C]|uniref:hypothetical protein n=1 Tax=Streptomyces sp. C TaxID=253839 RepID=UPI00101B552E|nr:hypothetical protein [Streptomyces sp. C]
MNRALARRLLAAPVLLWASLSATPAVADSCAYATVGSADGTSVVELYAYAGSGGNGAGRGGGHHGGHGNGHTCGHRGKGHAHDCPPWSTTSHRSPSPS